MDEPGTPGGSQRRTSSLSRSLRSRFGEGKPAQGKGMAVTRARKLKHVKIIPSSVKLDMAMQELKETKRRQTVGQKWNSAAVFSIMWAVYCGGLLIYFAMDPIPCKYWLAYFFLRFALLFPTSYLAYLWRSGWWPASFLEPEWVGVYIATYIALISTLGFSASINETCGRKVEISENTIWIELMTSSTLFKLRRGVCSVFTGGTDFTFDDAAMGGSCEAYLIDRRTHFEKNVFPWVGQLILYLFAFTSLFKPSFRATMAYTITVGVIGFLGCWYQGFDFWQDSERVLASDVFTAIFLFFCAGAVNIYSAHVLFNMERELVNANYELTANMEKRQRQPSGPKVVYLETDLQSSTKLWEHHTDVMHKAIKVHHNMMRALALEYFGWELATEGDAFLLAFHDCFDAISFALTFQDALMDEDWPDELLKDDDALLEWASVGPLEKETLSKIAKGNAIQRKGPDGGVELLAFQGLRVRMAIHMGSSEGGVKGPSCRFVHHLTDLSWGGMILLSEPVARTLEGVLEQLGNTASSAKEALSVPQMACMGIHTFGDYAQPMELSHVFNEPLRGRHVLWDEKHFKLRDSTMHALGFYDLPFREGVPGPVVICFAFIGDQTAIAKADPKAFTEAVLETHAAVGPLLMAHRGYNILPQREGSFMFAFHSPVDVAKFHADLQAALLQVIWPAKYKDLPSTKPVYGPGGGRSGKDLLYNGLTLSLGMSCGSITKNLTQSRAQFTGPTCNRAARVCSLAKSGKLLVFEHEFLEHQAEFDRAGIGCSMLFEGVTLKGVQGHPNVVAVDTDEITKRRTAAASNNPLGTGF